jgi:hypothetical protein
MLLDGNPGLSAYFFDLFALLTDDYPFLRWAFNMYDSPYIYWL